MVGILGLVVVVAGCAGSAADSKGEVVVFAAASLTDAFGSMKTEFEATHPDLHVVLNLAGSPTLREQIVEGAPADVFASANMSNMEQVAADPGVLGPERVFTRNRLEIAVPAGNPAGVTGLDDFARPELLIGLCAETVPCGEFGRQALSRAGVEPAVDTNEPDVKALLTKLQAGELDAGITYVTDVASGGESVDGIVIPDEYNVFADYPIAVLAGTANPEGSEAFIDFIMGDRGQAILGEHGFESP